MSLTPEIAQRRAREVFELFELGLEMKRAQLRRSHRDVADEEIEKLLREWLHNRPGALHGDAGPEGYRSRSIEP